MVLENWALTGYICGKKKNGNQMICLISKKKKEKKRTKTITVKEFKEKEVVENPDRPRPEKDTTYRKKMYFKFGQCLI